MPVGQTSFLDMVELPPIPIVECLPFVVSFKTILVVVPPEIGNVAASGSGSILLGGGIKIYEVSHRNPLQVLTQTLTVSPTVPVGVAVIQPAVEGPIIV
jgi:hypothetical protein